MRILAFTAVLAFCSAASAQVYVGDFDSLGLGITEFPGRADQDGWYSAYAVGDNYGEIQDRIANGGRALHQTSVAGTPDGAQTIDRNTIGIARQPGTTLRLKFDFFATSSDLSTIDPYTANITMGGGVGGAYNGLLSVDLGGGNGPAKADTGVNVFISRFNGVDNNELIFLPMAWNLAWNQWHTVEVTADFWTYEYIGISVNGVYQSLSGIALPAAFVAGAPAYTDYLSQLDTQVIGMQWAGVADTTDDIYWDNVEVVPEPASLAALGLGLSVLLRRRRQCKSK